MIDLKRAMLDPSDVFASPEEVVNSKDLNTQQMIQILQQWEYDEKEIMIAEEENMGGESSLNTIDRIHHLLIKLHERQAQSKAA